MSFSTTAQAANDYQLQQRIVAAVYSEATGNPELSDTVYAEQVRAGTASFAAFYWTVADAVDAEYAAGIAAGRGSPGHDPDVVTDGAITSAVVASWPPDPPV